MSAAVLLLVLLVLRLLLLNRQLRMAVFPAGPQPLAPDGWQGSPPDLNGEGRVPVFLPDHNRESEDMPDRTSERMSEDMTERMPERMSEQMSKEMQERMIERMCRKYARKKNDI